MYPNNVGYQKGSETSKAAAESIRGKANALKARILAEIKQSGGGLTTFEIAYALGIEKHEAHPRVAELHTAGLIYDAGRTRTNPDSGKEGAVWNITEHGILPITTRKSRAAKLERLLKESLVELERDPLLNSDLIKKIKEILE